MIIYFIIFIILCLLYFFLNNNKIKIEKIKLIYFNSSWCYWSKKLSSIIKELKNDPIHKNIDIIDIKCDLNFNKNICNKYNIYEYPTIKLISNNKIVEYLGDININELKLFIKNNI